MRPAARCARLARRCVGAVALTAACAAGGTGCAGAGADGGACGEPRWVTAWQAPPTDAVLPIDPSLGWLRSGPDQTFRVMLTPLGGGSRARLRLSNRFGRQPARFGAVTIARRGDGASIDAATSKALSFAGETTVTLAPGAEVLSDPLPFAVEAFETLAVSVHALDPGGVPTHHLVARQRSFATAPGAGDHTADAGGEAFTQVTTSRPLVTALDVLARGGASTLVALGDSLTDGFQAGRLGIPENPATIDLAQRYPDFLRRRLEDAGRPIAVANAGISGNRLLSNGLPVYGRAVLERLEPDVLESAGVRDVLLFVGINDIGQASGSSADELADGYRRVIARLHEHGARVLHTTLTPAGSSPQPGYSSDAARAARRSINEWIRAESPADAVVDFDAAVRDPGDPDVIDARFDGGDGLHLNADGYARLADAVDVTQLRGAACGGD